MLVTPPPADEDQWSGLPEEGQTKAASQSKQVKEKLEKRLKNEEPAELLSESADEDTRHPHLGRVLRIVSFILALFLLAFIGLYYFALPAAVGTLPSLVSSPRESLGAYKRVFQGFVDYFPSTSLARSESISEIGRGGSVTFLSSADIVPEQGVEGVLRLELGSAARTVRKPDIDMNFKVIWDASSEVPDAYIFFNSWPETFDSLLPISTLDGVWFEYSSASRPPGEEGATELLSYMSEEDNTAQQELLDFLWGRALSSRAIEWKIKRLAYRDERDVWLTDIEVTVDKGQLQKFVSSVREDERFEQYELVIDGPSSDPSILDMLASIESASGRVTVGIINRLVYESVWDFDVFNHSLGTMRGHVESTLTPLQLKTALTKPEETQDLSELYTVALLLDALPFERLGSSSSVDTDADGLTDDVELELGTDPEIADTDGDGFIDGEEVEAGYDPNGPGLLVAP